MKICAEQAKRIDFKSVGVLLLCRIIDNIKQYRVFYLLQT